MKEIKKKLNAKFECHVVGPHALSHEVFAFIYIYIYIYMDWFYNYCIWCIYKY